MASANPKVCVLHCNAVLPTANIILFKDSTLKTCKEAELVYQARPNWQTSVYKEIKLPSVPNDFLGYHSKCYSNYTSVPKAEREAALAAAANKETSAIDSSISGNCNLKLYKLNISRKIFY